MFHCTRAISRVAKIAAERSRLAWVLILALLILAMPRAAGAQVFYGSLTGNVTDPTDAYVPGAKVEALNISNVRGNHFHLEPGRTWDGNRRRTASLVCSEADILICNDPVSLQG